jgi:tetratricopeptide (TPR) repeat protein
MRWILLLVAALAIVQAGEAGPRKQRQPVTMAGTSFYFHPYLLETDVGDTAAERKKFRDRFAKPLIDTSNFFLQTYTLSPKCFDEFAEFYKGNNFEKPIRVRVWKNYEDFLGDFQFRYDTDTIPGAFFGRSEIRDEYGKGTGKWIREIGTSAEGDTDQEILRHLYHELGHLFMDTYMLYGMEVPSWIEEGNAELFQYRIGNGTRPEGERDRRTGWLVEMVTEGSTIPWPEFIKVKNLDNLNFTFQDPLRSTVQYAQAWSVIEFVVDSGNASSPRRKAYSKFLADMKEAGRVARSAGEVQKLRDTVLYEKQEALFKKNFGADILAIEDVWKKEWIQKGYERMVKTKPILRYYRGDWHLLRSRFARTKDAREEAIAKADAIFNECVQLSPKMAEGYVGKGRIAMMRGNLDEAGQWFDQGLALGADGFEANFYGGLARLESGSASEAVPALRKAMAERPTDADVNLALGRALAASGGKVEDALHALRKAREMDAGLTFNAALVEGGVLFRAGRLSAAYLSWLRANSSGRSNLTPLLMAIAKAGDNETEEALAILAQHPTDGNATALAGLIKAGSPLPDVVIGKEGWPTLRMPGDGPAAGSGGGDAGQFGP